MKTKPNLLSLFTSLTLGLAFLMTSCSKEGEKADSIESQGGESDVAATVASSSLRSPFQSLPEGTIGAVRFNNSAAVRAEYVENTKVGKLLFSDQKIEEYKAFIDNLVEGDEDAAKFVAAIGEVGLELDDIYGMLSSDMGVAIVEREVPGFSAMPTVFVWAEAEQEVVDSVYSAILDSAAEDAAIERIDQDLAGIVGTRIRNVERGDSFLTAKLENRFLFAIGFPRDVISTQEEAEVFEKAEWEALGYFVQAQQGDGGAFLTDFYADPGVSAAMPNFESRFEVLGDISKLLQFAPEKSAQMVELLDLGQFKKFAAWSGLVEMEERSVFFVGIPEPRAGVATLIENDLFDFQPPAWVPSAANTYSTFSFDFSKLYGVVIEIARKMMPPEMVDQQLAQVNGQLQAMLQTDLETLLASFGSRIHAIEYPIERSQVNVDGTLSDLPKAPSAFVLDFSRPDILEAGVAMLGMVAANPESNIQLLDEQGFSGVQLSTPDGALVVAFGQGKLVVAVGETAASRLFAVLNAPPTGEDALANDSEFRAFLARNNPKQGILFSYAQGDNVMKNLIPMFKLFGNSMAQSTQEDDALLLEEMLGLLPSEEELEGLIGAVFTRAYYDEWGLTVEGINEYK